MRTAVPVESNADLCYQAEQLYSDLLNAGLLIEAACVSEALFELRRKVREEQGE